MQPMCISLNDVKSSELDGTAKRLNDQVQVMVGRGGLEPPTSRLSGVRSNHLSYRPIPGGAYRVRTDDPLLAKQVLYQLS